MRNSVSTSLLLILHNIVQTPDIRLDLDDKLIPIVEQLLGVLGKSHARGGARDDDGALLQGRALGEEADNLGD